MDTIQQKSKVLSDLRRMGDVSSKELSDSSHHTHLHSRHSLGHSNRSVCSNHSKVRFVNSHHMLSVILLMISVLTPKEAERQLFNAKRLSDLKENTCQIEAASKIKESNCKHNITDKELSLRWQEQQLKTSLNERNSNRKTNN